MSTWYRALLIFMPILVLSGCWISKDEVLDRSFFLVRVPFPQEILATYNNQSHVIRQIPELSAELDSPVYEGMGFEQIKLSYQEGPRGEYLLVQAFNAEDDLYTYFTLNGLTGWDIRELPERLFKGWDAELGLWHSGRDMQFEGPKNYPLSKLRIEIKPFLSLAASLQGSVAMVSLDGLSNVDRTALLTARDREAIQRDQLYVDSRYNRAVKERFLENCNKAFALANSEGTATISALLSSFTRLGNSCVMNNGIIEIKLRISGIDNLQCTASGTGQICDLNFSVTCEMDSNFSNNQTINLGYCNLIESVRQPVTMRVNDDGRNVDVLSFEMAKP